METAEDNLIAEASAFFKGIQFASREADRGSMEQTTTKMDAQDFHALQKEFGPFPHQCEAFMGMSRAYLSGFEICMSAHAPKAKGE